MKIDLQNPRFQLFLISLITLFCELLIIRWLATEVRIFAYFKNIPLMSALLGLSLGFIWTNKKKDLFKWTGITLFFLSVMMIFALAAGLTFLSFINKGANVMLFGTFVPFSNLTAIKTLGWMLAIFWMSTFFFVGLGQMTGKLFQNFKPLEAYSINVFGGLVGIIIFSTLCYLNTNPGVWLIVAGLLFLLFQRRISYVLLIILGLLYSIIIASAIAKIAYGSSFVETAWSPYYRIDIRESQLRDIDRKVQKAGYGVYINYDSFQSMADSRPQTIAHFAKPLQNELLEFYEKPFKCYGKPPANVLILGAGSGSDVSAALRSGAGHVDAVEIDPVIYKLGKRLNPDQPYSSDRVSVHLMDARTYLRNCTKKYNVIVFAMLDSHTAFSSLSSLRTDNYIFTGEALSEATRLLTTDGIVCDAFVAIPDWLWDRHSKTLALATHSQPLGFFKKGVLPIGFLVASPGIVNKAPKQLNLSWASRSINFDNEKVIATDDWPFLFLPEKKIPSSYVILIAVIFTAATIPIFSQFHQGVRNFLNWEMFGLGMGFMLLEVRSMANLSLLFGSTWIVNSVIISAVMLFILCANWLASKLNLNHIPNLALGLILSLLLSTLINANTLAGLGAIEGGGLGAFVFLLPLVFASSIFSLLFKYTKNPTTCLAFNLIGGLFGICLEYLSMWLGIAALGYIALAIYAIVFTLYMLKHSQMFSDEQVV